MGLLDFLTGDSDPLQSGGALGDIGSELGGTLQDWATATETTSVNDPLQFVGGLLSGPANNFDLNDALSNMNDALNFASDAGLTLPNLGIGPDVSGAQLPAYSPPDFSIQPVPGPGGTMNDLMCVARPPSVPWRSLGRRVNAAARLFGPTIALQVVAALAACYSARTGLQISAIDVLMRSAGARRRRSSGITGRQLSTTRRTLRKLSSMQHYLGAYRGGGGRRRAARARGRKH